MYVYTIKHSNNVKRATYHFFFTQTCTEKHTKSWLYYTLYKLSNIENIKLKPDGPAGYIKCNIIAQAMDETSLVRKAKEKNNVLRGYMDSLDEMPTKCYKALSV